MLLVLIGIALGLVYIFFDHHYQENKYFDASAWLYSLHHPEYDPEAEREAELQYVVENAPELWKDYL